MYEDENDNYNYEKGFYSTITFSWNNARRTLTIDDRKGTFLGMITQREFNIVLVTSSNNTCATQTEKADKQVVYRGSKLIVKL